MLLIRLLVCGGLSALPPAMLSAASGTTTSHARTNAFVISSSPIVIDAPADVYFGTYQLSNLGVRNAIHDMTIEGNSPLALPGQVARIEAVQSALAAWMQLYPKDRWLPSAMVNFASFLRAKHIPQYDRAALSLLDETERLFPATKPGRTARAQLAAFELLPAFDLGADAVLPALPRIFESQPTRIGENRHHHFL